VNVVLFSHSALSDWNHGNAHFLRGVVSALQRRGHQVCVYEPHDAWSVVNAVAEHGEACLAGTRDAYPDLDVVRYKMPIDLDEALADADLVLVHEWNTHELVAAIGVHHLRNRGYVLLFHDTHHRSVSDPQSMAAYELSAYDGVLAFGDVIRRRYLERGWATQAWTWHEAADTRVFRPRPDIARTSDLVWIGNWGDEERTAELHEFLIEPVRALRLRATVYGVRYPPAALAALAAAGIEYRGWLPNYRVPDAFARHRVTVHVPRRPYVRMLPGIPTIRPFEAMACGIPLVSAAWNDAEGLFTAGDDYLRADTGDEMTRHLDTVLSDAELASSLAARSVETIRRRHTCDHRADELLAIVDRVRMSRVASHASVVHA
jgi:spore maturation protein CgeB